MISEGRIVFLLCQFSGHDSCKESWELKFKEDVEKGIFYPLCQEYSI